MKLLFPAAAALLIATSALSQQPSLMHAPDGGAREGIQPVLILPKTDAPFTATVLTEWTRQLADGTTTTIKNRRFVARDSSGRIFEERRYLSPNGDKEDTRLWAIQIADPTRHEFYNCNPNTRICLVTAFKRSAVLPPPRATANLSGSRVSITTEDLGHQRTENLDLVGSREVTTVKEGVNGYQRDEPTIKEFWFSPRLDQNVIVKRFEPRGGAQTISLGNIVLSDPGPTRFQPPEGYRVVHIDQ